MTCSKDKPSETAPSRRRFLARAGAAVAFGAAPGRTEAATTSYRAKIYPIDQPTNSGPYPEQAMARYSAAQGQWGVAFSGGGSRAFSAALGQMRGLHAAGVVDDIGAISCVSGGTWFGATYTFAPESLTDATLLGPIVSPGNISAENLRHVEYQCLGSRITHLTETNLEYFAAQQLVDYAFGRISFDKLYSRILNDAFLRPYGLGNTTTSFTLNSATAQAITTRNPDLTSFLLPKRNRPFFIAGGTQVFLTEKQKQTPVRGVGLSGQVYRGIEYTPLYVGAARLVKQRGGNGLPYGGGFVESFAFNTSAPASTASDMVTVAAGKYPFVLSDLMGSSSAAVAEYVERYLPKKFSAFDPFPSFDYWPVTKTAEHVPAAEYVFSDGGTLDDTGVVSLLRRGYRTIFAFVNSGLPIGSPGHLCRDGIDGQISRLFGLMPKDTDGKTTRTKVFDDLKFFELAAGLHKAKQEKRAVVYAGDFPVIERNDFGLQPYTPKIFWIYNDLNGSWFDKLQPQVQNIITSADGPVANFPNYKLEFQNKGELLYLSPTQVNLLAHMTAYTVTTGFKDFGYAFGVPVR